ncbi:2Fe-2S iron-sulfur cluster-binding protein, partial [Photobacterium galatheae]|uniref:2Fe-2S ferredoxin-type domain-containing protein n=1 Tax=Photobacterium galatheae TaxID=1654360 RepID=A0A066RKG5_9GAMM
MANDRLTLPSCQVRVLNDKPILIAAAKSGVLLDYHCAEGRCGACMKTLKSGQVFYRDGTPIAFIPQGKTLTCRDFAESNLEIE